MWGTHVLSGTPRMRSMTLVQVAPPSRVTCTLPSSVPTQITPRSTGLGAMVMMVVWFSAPVASRVSPPLSPARCFSGSFVVRSGEMISHVFPPSLVLCTNWLPK